MADDILSRLRDHSRTRAIGNEKANHVIHRMRSEGFEAADEIERLRKLDVEYGQLEAANIMADPHFDGDSDHPDCISRLLASIERATFSRPDSKEGLDDAN